MKIEIVKSTPTHLTAVLSNTEPAMANAIRRSIIAEVPTMAIDEITIYENTTVMFDEYLAHRIGMIPLTTDLKNYKNPEDCCGGECASCSVEMNLDENGPKMVYSSDLKTNDSKVKPVSGKIPIIELQDGQRLRLEAKAVLGKGENHAKWQAGNASYKYYPNVKIGKKANAKELAKVCPTKAIKTTGTFDAIKCIGCGECVEKDPDNVKLEMDRTKFVFYVETNGQLKAQNTMEEAFKIINNKVTDLEKQLK